MWRRVTSQSVSNRLTLFITNYNSVALVREQSIPAKLVLTFADRGVYYGQRDGSPRPYSRFSTPESLIFLSNSSSVVLKGWLDRLPDPLLLRKSGSTENRTRDLWICSQELWPLGHRGGRTYMLSIINVLTSKKKCIYPCKRPWRLIVLWDDEDPTFSRQ
jgi:hypothetical protein